MRHNQQIAVLSAGGRSNREKELPWLRWTSSGLGSQLDFAGRDTQFDDGTHAWVEDWAWSQALNKEHKVWPALSYAYSSAITAHKPGAFEVTMFHGTVEQPPIMTLLPEPQYRFNRAKGDRGFTIDIKSMAFYAQNTVIPVDPDAEPDDVMGAYSLFRVVDHDTRETRLDITVLHQFDNNTSLSFEIKKKDGTHHYSGTLNVQQPTVPGDYLHYRFSWHDDVIDLRVFDKDDNLLAGGGIGMINAPEYEDAGNNSLIFFPQRDPEFVPIDFAMYELIITKFDG